jgi:haloacetate dehalogenase
MQTPSTPQRLFEFGRPTLSVNCNGVQIAAKQINAVDKRCAPMLLIHGHPQSMAMWHAVAPGLAQHRDVVLMDLRGYGDSDRPLADAQATQYTKREMAKDAIAVMSHFGHTHFDVLAHDRGARVAHRLAVDHAGAVQRLMLLDIAPTLAMYSHTTEAFARAYWHWFFLIQQNGLPQAWIGADPVRYLHACMSNRGAEGLAVFEPQALAEYERCVQIPESAQAVCADYRASAGIDLVHDRADVAKGIKLTQPLAVICGKYGVVDTNFDVAALWLERALTVRYSTLPCSHYIAEEEPQALLHEALAFFN